MGRTNTWGPILVDETMGCSPTTDRSRETWGDTRDGSTKPCTNTMMGIHMVGNHASQNKVGFQLTLPAKLHHLSFINIMYLVNLKPFHFHCKGTSWLNIVYLVNLKPFYFYCEGISRLNIMYLVNLKPIYFHCKGTSWLNIVYLVNLKPFIFIVKAPADWTLYLVNLKPFYYLCTTICEPRYCL